MDELKTDGPPSADGAKQEQSQEQSTATDQAKQDIPQTPHGPDQLKKQVIDFSNAPDSYQEKTLGEQRIRTSFNVSGKSEVDSVKSSFAGLIDLCEAHKEKDPRLAAKAQTEIENAAMWTVKLLTA